MFESQILWIYCALHPWLHHLCSDISITCSSSADAVFVQSCFMFLWLSQRNFHVSSFGRKHNDDCPLGEWLPRGPAHCDHLGKLKICSVYTHFLAGASELLRLGWGPGTGIFNIPQESLMWQPKARITAQNWGIRLLSCWIYDTVNKN